MNKVRICDFKVAVRIADNWGRFNNNQYKVQLQSCDFIKAVRIIVIKTVGIADNWNRFDDD